MTTSLSLSLYSAVTSENFVLFKLTVLPQQDDETQQQYKEAEVAEEEKESYSGCMEGSSACCQHSPYSILSWS